MKHQNDMRFRKGHVFAYQIAEGTINRQFTFGNTVLGAFINFCKMHNIIPTSNMKYAMLEYKPTWLDDSFVVRIVA